jgi:hypothetical protein
LIKQQEQLLNDLNKNILSAEPQDHNFETKQHQQQQQQQQQTPSGRSTPGNDSPWCKVVTLQSLRVILIQIFGVTYWIGKKKKRRKKR